MTEIRPSQKLYSHGKAELDKEFENIYSVLAGIPWTDTAPNGSRQGRRGEDVVLYNNTVSGNVELWVATDEGPAGGTTWQKIGP